MVWIAFITLAGIAQFLLLRPFLRPGAAVNEARTSELGVYRDQLRELDADLARGIIAAAEAESARLEIKRKMLAVAPVREAARNPQRVTRMLGVLVGAGVPALALALYLMIGQPGLPGRDFSSEPPEAPQTPDVEKLAADLAERLKLNPSDAQGWRMLGWTYTALGRHADAVKAYERAVALDGKNADTLAQYGEALVRAADGVVTAQAEAIFERARAITPHEPRAGFFLGLALEQRGKSRQALGAWVKIIREGQADAAWMPALRQRAIELAVKLKLDPLAEIPGVTSGEVAAASQSVTTGQIKQIQDMVAGLEKRLRTNANDLEGWLMLARSRKVLGDPAAARAALERAGQLFAGDPKARARIAAVAAQLDLN